jgi:two-component system, cell cycle response regulator DivK
MPKILIVEDCKETRDSLASQLQGRGFAVVSAGDGKMGVAMALTEKPDLVLMDMNLPEMDGWEAMRQIKSAPGGETLPVIALKEQTKPGDLDRAVEAGCASSQNKPIEFADLFHQIEALLRGRATLETPLPAEGECIPECP